MNKLVFVVRALFVAAVSASTVTSALSQERESASKSIQFEGRQWITNLPGKVSVQEFHGRSALSVRGSLGNYVYLRDSEFLDGTIEVDMAVESRGIAGIAFRGNTEGTRIDKVCFLFVGDDGSAGDNPVRQAVISRRDGSLCVLRLRPSGENKTGPSVRHDEWFQAKIVVAGTRIEVFLNDGDEPVFVVEKMLDVSGPGTVGVWGRGAHFADFRFTPSKPKRS